MPDIGSVAGIQRNQMTVVIAEEYDAAGSGYSARPGLGWSGHWILPFPFAGARIDCADKELAELVRLRACASAREVLLGLGFFSGTRENVALFERHDVHQAG